MNNKEYVYKKIMKVKTLNKTLVLGYAVDLFFEMYQGEYTIIKDKYDILNLLKNFKSNDKPFVLGDISLLDKSCQERLSKFIEETTSPLIVFARKDNISSHLINRFNNIVKIPFPIKAENHYTIKDFVNYKYKNKIKFDDELESLKHCPEYFALISNPHINKNTSEEIIDLCIKNLENTKDN